jgi:hypothetical protein
VELNRLLPRPTGTLPVRRSLNQNEENAMNAGKFSFALAFTSALIASAANANGTLQRCSEIAA